MKKIFYIVFLALFFVLPVMSKAKERDILLEVEVLLDGKKPISGAYVEVVNQIPKLLGMPDVENIGVRLTDKNGLLSYQLKNVNSKGILNINILRDKCGWSSDFKEINLNYEKGQKFKFTLKPKSKHCKCFEQQVKSSLIDNCSDAPLIFDQ